MSEEDYLLQRFKQEVLSRGREACLPVNLGEEWRAILSQAIDRYFADGDDSLFGLVMVAMLGILSGKNSGAKVNVPLDTMFEYLQSYRRGLELETVRRKLEGNVPATLKTIFKRDL